MAQLRKYYPDKNRKDWFKWEIVKTGESIFNKNAKLATDANGDEMCFDDKKHAHRVCKAINNVESKINNYG